MNLCRIVILFCLIGLAPNIAALQSNSSAPITIESDRAERDENIGVTKYLGEVIITQGDLSIRAEHVTVNYTDERVSRILCEGSPSSFRLNSSSDEEVLGLAEAIEYVLVEETVNLTRNASLSRNGTIIRGDTINYDLKNGVWKARGNSQSRQKRIQLVIPASEINDRTKSNSSNLKNTIP